MIVDTENCEEAVFSDVSTSAVSDMTHVIQASPSTTDLAVTALSFATPWGESCPHSVSLSPTSPSILTLDASLMKLSISTTDACTVGDYSADLIHSPDQYNSWINDVVYPF